MGRHREQAAVRNALREAPIVTLTGPGGVGKTRLAEALAQDRVCELVGARTLDQVVAQLAAAHSVSLGGSRDVDEALAKVAVAARGLVVLDNAEHVLDEVRTVCEALRGAARISGILVTSRVRLGVDGEHEVGLSGLDVADGLTLLERDGVSWADDDRSDAEALVQALDGLPLALELAASRLAWLRPREVLTQLGDPRLLARASEPGRHGGLERVLRWSWELLAAPLREVLAQLSTFEGAFTLADAEQVVQVSGAVLPEAIEALGDASLLTAGPTTRLLETVRRFARTHLRDDDEVWARHGTWATRGPVDTTPLTGRQRSAHHDSVRERTLDLAAVQLRDPTRASLASLQLAQAALMTLPGAAQLDVLDRGIAAGGTPEVRAWLLFRRGQVRSRLGNMAAAQRDLSDAATLAEQHGAWACWAWARRSALLADGATPRVLAVLEPIRDRVRAEGLLGPWAMLEGALAAVSSEAGFAQRARQHIDQAILLFAQHEDPLNEAVARLARARIVADDTSLPGARRALELFSAHGYAAAVPDAHLEIGWLLFLSSRHDEAAEELRTATEQARLQDSPAIEALAWRSLGWIAIVQAQSVEADRCLRQAHAVALRVAHLGAIADAELGWAILDLVEGRAEAATQRLDALNHPWCPGLGAYWKLACEVLQGSDLAARTLAAMDPAAVGPDLDELHAVFLGLVALHDRDPAGARECLDVRRRPALAQMARQVLRAALRRSLRGAPVVVSRGGSCVVLPDGTRIDLGRQTVLRRILLRLVERRLEAPGEPQSVESVLAAGWPDEQVQHEAGVNRVYVSISRLRRTGLGHLVQQREGGYLLDPAHSLAWGEAG